MGCRFLGGLNVALVGEDASSCEVPDLAPIVREQVLCWVASIPRRFPTHTHTLTHLHTYTPTHLHTISPTDRNTGNPAALLRGDDDVIRDGVAPGADAEQVQPGAERPGGDRQADGATLDASVMQHGDAPPEDVE